MLQIITMRIYTLFLFIACFACSKVDHKGTYELSAIKNILETERRAHLNKDVSLLLSDGTDPVLDVSRGKVKLYTVDETRQRFTNYFSAVEFLKWDDVAEPIFYFSADSTMATVVVQKQVIVKRIQDAQTDTTDFAWTAVYKKDKGEWKMVVITSTNK